MSKPTVGELLECLTCFRNENIVDAACLTTKLRHNCEECKRIIRELIEKYGGDLRDESCANFGYWLIWSDGSRSCGQCGAIIWEATNDVEDSVVVNKEPVKR